MDPLDSQIRVVVFFDTPDLALNRQGVVVRARRVQGRGDDSVVKLRPVRARRAFGRQLRRVSPGMVVELDAMPGGYVCSATMKNRLGTTDVQRVLKGERPIRKLFSKPQRAFFAAHAPDGLELDDLSVLGPIFVVKLRFIREDFGRELVTEVWLYPDGSRILGISTKCAPSEMFQVAAEARGVPGAAEASTWRAAADEDARRRSNSSRSSGSRRATDRAASVSGSRAGRPSPAPSASSSPMTHS